jgi:hypothetical protein
MHQVFLVCCVFTGCCLVTTPNVIESSTSVLSGFCPHWLVTVSQQFFMATIPGHCLPPSHICPPLISAILRKIILKLLCLLLVPTAKFKQSDAITLWVSNPQHQNYMTREQQCRCPMFLTIHYNRSSLIPSLIMAAAPSICRLTSIIIMFHRTNLLSRGCYSFSGVNGCFWAGRWNLPYTLNSQT